MAIFHNTFSVVSAIACICISSFVLAEEKSFLPREQALVTAAAPETLQEAIPGTYAVKPQDADTQHQTQLLGELNLKLDGEYLFHQTGSWRKLKTKGQDGSYFAKNPQGTYDVEYMRGYDARSSLQDIQQSGEEPVAKLKLNSKQQDNHIEYELSYTTDNGLQLKGQHAGLMIYKTIPIKP